MIVSKTVLGKLKLYGIISGSERNSKIVYFEKLKSVSFCDKIKFITSERVLKMKKCDFCAKEISYFDQYCSDECHAKTNKYYETSDKFGSFFSIVNGICVFGIPVGLFLLPFAEDVGMVVALISCLILGIMLILLPFPTDNMISKFKLQKAMKITRIIGMCVIALGFAIVAVGLFIFK